MSLKDFNFKMINLCENMKVLKDKERDYYAFLNFFPKKIEHPQSSYGYIQVNNEIVHYFSYEEWRDLICIT